MRNQTIGGRHRPHPSAEEERHDQCRDKRDAEIFADKEHAELHPGVFGMKTRHQFALRLGQVKGQAVGLGDPGDQEDDKAEELGDAEPHVLSGPPRSRGD